MKTVHKYQLRTGANRALLLPRGARVLSVQNQQEQLMLWAEVDDEIADTETRTFYVAYTGAPLSDRYSTYIGTVQFADGQLVCHVFEEPQ